MFARQVPIEYAFDMIGRQLVRHSPSATTPNDLLESDIVVIGKKDGVAIVL